jgi:hypothetical protein
MKKGNLAGLLFVLCFLYTACDNPTSSGDPQPSDLQKYQNIGARVAAKKWSVNYDCSNFSTQFYQNCYKAGLPCRVRLGTSGGPDFSAGNHAWNSVKINGQWVNWEPQKNSVYSGHTQTKTTPSGIDMGNFTEEDVGRIIYELVGRYVPGNVIDAYEIDTYWGKNSPFYGHFLSIASCLSDDGSQIIQDLISNTLQHEIPDDNSGGIFITADKKHLIFFFQYNSKYYGIVNLEENDPAEGRNAAKGRHLTLKEIILSGAEFTRTNVNLSFRNRSPV